MWERIWSNKTSTLHGVAAFAIAGALGMGWIDRHTAEFWWALIVGSGFTLAKAG